MTRSLLFIALFTASLASFSQTVNNRLDHLFTQPRNYIVYSASGSINIDGKLNDDAWATAPWSELFVDIEGAKKPLPLHQSRFKMLWDADHLYIAAELDEPHIWGTLDKHDQIVYHDNDFEVFIDPDGDTHNYYEIEVNTLNTLFDLFMNRPYRNGGKPLISWNVKDIRSAIGIDGTLNDPSDTDRKWYVEMAIPFRSISVSDEGSTPVDKTIWKMNFSRVQWTTDVVDGTYKKRMDTVRKRPLPENNWVWSPQGVINMHYPERWGFVQFSKIKAGEGSVRFKVPDSERYRQHLWYVYYKQREYFQKNKKFAGEIVSLNMPDDVRPPSNSGPVKIELSEKGFTASIRSRSGTQAWQIDHEGKTTNLLSQP